MTVQSFSHSYFSFKYSVFHPTILKPQGHGAIFTYDCNNLLKICFCCCSARKLPHVPKLYFGNFYRAFKISNNYVAATLIPVTFFSIWVFFLEHLRFTGQPGKEEGIYLTPICHFHRHLDISRALTFKCL